jgi:tetratricopeptide (TPR) repeat protein
VIRMARIFLSYARVDEVFALKLARALRASNIDLWIDRDDIRPGQNWDRAVEEALVACASVLLILSPDALKSEHVMDEVSYALNKSKQLTPILFKACDLPPRLHRKQFIDFRGDFDSAFKRCYDHLSGNRHELQPTVTSTPSKPSLGTPEALVVTRLEHKVQGGPDFTYPVSMDMMFFINYHKDVLKGKDPDDISGDLYQGDTYYRQGLYDEAIKSYGLAISYMEKNYKGKDENAKERIRNAYVKRGRNFMMKKDYEKAIADFNIVINPPRLISWLSQPPEDPFAKYIPMAYFNRGYAHSERRDYDLAIADYTKLIELKSYAFSNIPEAYNNRGTAYFAKKDYNRAISDYTKAIELSPKYVGAYKNRALAYRAERSTSSLSLASADDTKVAELEPANKKL